VVFALAPALAVVGADLGKPQLERYWDLAADCFRFLGPSTVPGVFPQLFELERYFAEKEKAGSEIWLRLFRPLAARNNERRFLTTFLAAGESLFLSEAHRNCPVPGVDRLAALRLEDEFSKWFVRSGGSLKVVDNDLFLPLVAKVPPDALTGKVNDESERALLARARFASTVYGNDPARLARIFAGMGALREPPNPLWLPTFTTLALIGYLIHEGTTAESVLRRMKLLMAPNKGFWWAFPSHCAEDAETIQQELQKQLDKLEIGEAEEVAKLFVKPNVWRRIRRILGV
jgi:hypothetical protein